MYDNDDAYAHEERIIYFTTSTIVARMGSNFNISMKIDGRHLYHAMEIKGVVCVINARRVGDSRRFR